MEIVGAEADFVNEAARQWICRRRGDESHIEAGKWKAESAKKSEIPNVVSYDFEELPVAVQRRVLQSQLVELGVLADFELVERLRHSPDVFASVSPNFSVSRNAAGRVSLRTPPPVGFKVNELTVNLVDRAGEVDFGGVQFRWDFAGVTKPVSLGKQNGRELFDADKVGGQITLRHWRAGDRFQPIGLKSAVKLQDLFTNQKISRIRRHDLIVAEAAGGKIFWVENLRMAEHFKLTPGTKRRLVWRWRGGSR
jgi:tRNA(Ile)-lysidine synthase